MQLKKSDLLPSTEKPSKESKSFSKGYKLEQNLSSSIHQTGTPILISSKLFRKHGLGQVDLAIFQDHQVWLFEVKSSDLGLSKTQYLRLNRSLEFLIQVFDSPGKMQVINSLPKELSFLNLSI